MVVAVAVLFSLQPLWSSHAQASGKCQSLLLTFLFPQTDPIRRAATGCECPGSVHVLVVWRWVAYQYFDKHAQAFPRG